jgi:hypothetical protein
MDGSAATDECGRRGRRSRVVLIPRRWYPAQCAQAHCRDTVAKKPGAPRRARISRKPSRREGRVVRLTCGSCPVHFCPHGGHGPQSRSGLPCALHIKEGRVFRKARARIASRGRCRTRCRHPREGGDPVRRELSIIHCRRGVLDHPPSRMMTPVGYADPAPIN